MTTYKLKVHIGGQHDFDAEGDKETVERQFAVFTDLVRNVLKSSVRTTDDIPSFMERFVRTDAESIFLASLPATEQPAADTILLLLLAHSLMRQEKIVRGSDLLKSLKKSGIQINRIDRALHHYLGGTRSLVVKMGVRRGVTYQLTERGTAKAQEIAKSL
jgi:hypothetical protein